MNTIQDTFLKHVQRSTVKGNEVIGLCPFHADQTASWSGNIDSGLWTCFACKAKGNLKDFCEKRKIPVPGEKVVATYEYKDEKGELLYVVERLEAPGAGKRFLQKKWNAGTKTFENSLGDVRRVLFNLQQLSRAMGPSEVPSVSGRKTVWITEGEKCVHRLEKVLEGTQDVVTCSPGGASNWRDEYAVHFDSKDVVILPDNDKPGKDYANTVVDSLKQHGSPKSIKVVELPGLAEKEDIYDWLERGNSVEALRKIVDATPFAYTDELSAESMADLLIEPWQPPRWLIEGVWTEGRGFVAGEPGVGKTWVTLSMAVSIATGRPFLGIYEVKKPGPVLFLQEEESRQNFRDKVDMLARGHDLTPEDFRNFHHLTQKMVQIPKDIKSLIRTVKRLNAKAVFIDSFREVYTGDENSSTEVKPVLDGLRQLQIETGASIVIVHHLNKPTKGNEHLNVFTRMRGSSALWGWRETIIGLTPADMEGGARVQFQFKDAPERLPIQIARRHSGEFAEQKMTLEVTVDERGAEIMDRVYDFIKDNNGECTRGDVKTKKGLAGNGQERLQALKILEKEGRVKVLDHKFLATADYEPKSPGF
jgi:hypothetical protein